MVVSLYCIKCATWRNHEVDASQTRVTCDGCHWDHKIGFHQREYVRRLVERRAP